MSFYSGSLLLTSIASLLLGSFVLFRGGQKRSSLALGFLSFGIAFWCFGQFMGEMAASKREVLFWTRANIAAAILIPVFYLHFILAFIEEERRDRTLLTAAYSLAALFLLADLTPLFVADVAPRLGYRYYPVPGMAYPLFSIFLASLFALGFVKLAQFLKRCTGGKKNQAKYVFIASLIGFAGGGTAFFPVFNINLPVISHFALPLYLAITVYAIVKHKLLDVNVVIREGLVYSTLTLLFTGFYALAVLAANYLLANLVIFPPALEVVPVVFSAVVVFQPLKDRVQKGVDRVFLQGEFRYQKTIDDLSQENRKLLRTIFRADKLAALGNLSAGMAHEIKNPLASIKGMTQVLEENISDPSFIAKYQEVVTRQIDRINALVEKLLKFGRPQELALSKFNLNSIIEDVLGLVDNQCVKNGIKVVRESKDGQDIEGDPEQLSQVLMNLVLNAIEAMPRGGTLIVRSYKVNAQRSGIKVADSGEGIAPADLDRIFDPFFTTKPRGTGMGLAVAYRIVKEHGGEINVESGIGKGTKFTLWLPIKQDRSA